MAENLSLEAQVDVILSGGRVDESSLVKAIANKLASANVPPILIEPQFALDGKPVSKEKALQEVTRLQEGIRRQVADTHQQIKGLSATELAGDLGKELVRRRQEFVNLGLALETVEKAYDRVDDKQRQFSKETKDIFANLAAGGDALGLTQEQLRDVRAYVGYMKDLDRTMKKVVTEQAKLGPQKRAYNVAPVGAEKANYEAFEAKPIPIPSLEAQNAFFSKGLSRAATAVSDQGLFDAQKKIDDKRVSEEKATQRRLDREHDRAVKERGERMKQTIITDAKQAAAAELNILGQLRKDLRQEAQFSGGDVGALSAVAKKAETGYLRTQDALEDLIRTHAEYGRNLRSGKDGSTAYYNALGGLIERAKGELAEFGRLQNSISHQAKLQKDKLDTGEATGGILDDVRYGKRQFEAAGGLGSRTSVLRVAKEDLPFVVKYLQAAKKETEEFAAALLKTEGASRRFKEAAKEMRSYDMAIERANHHMRGHHTLLSQTRALLSQFARYGIGYAALYQVQFAVRALVKSVSNLEDELKNIEAITGATAKQMLNIEASVKRTAVTTRFNTTEIAEAARILAQAGVDPATFGETLNAVAQFATATGSTIEIASDLITTMRTVFDDLGDQTLANQLTRALNVSKLTAADLKTILSISAQMAETYNLTSDQYLAAAATLRDAGLKASTVATGFRQGLIEIFSPDSKTIKVLAQRYSELGEALTGSEIRAKFLAFQEEANPLLSALRELRRLGFNNRGKSTFQRTFDVRAENAIKALINNFEDLERAESKITFGNAAAQAAETQMESLNASLDNLGAAISAVAYDMSSDLLPQLEDLVDWLTNAVNAMGDLNNELTIAGRTNVAGHLGNAIMGGVTGAIATPGGPLARLGGAVGGAVIGGAGSYGVGQLELPENVSRVLEPIAAIAGWVATLASIRGLRNLGRRIKGEKPEGIRDALSTVAEGADTIDTIRQSMKQNRKFLGRLLGFVKGFGKRIVALFGPWGAAAAAVATVYTIVTEFTKDAVSTGKKLKAARQQALKARTDLEREQREIDAFRQSRPGRKARKGTTAQKAEQTFFRLEDVERTLSAQLGISDISRAFELLVEIDRKASEVGDPLRTQLMGVLDGLTDLDLTDAKYAETVNGLIEEAGAIQSGLEGMAQSLQEQVDTLRLKDEEKLSTTEKAMLEAYREIVDRDNLYSTLEGNSEVIARQMADFFREFLYTVEVISEASKTLADAMKKNADEAERVVELAVRQIGEANGRFRARGLTKSRIDEFRNLPFDERIGLIDQELGEVQQQKYDAERALGFWESWTASSAGRAEAAANLEQAERILYEARGTAIMEVQEQNADLMRQAQRVVGDVAALYGRAKGDEALQSYLRRLETTSPNADLLKKARAGTLQPSDLTRDTPTAAIGLSLKEFTQEMAEFTRTIEAAVRAYPEFGTLPEHFVPDVERRKETALAKIEAGRAARERRFDDAIAAEKQVHEAQMTLNRERIAKLNELKRTERDAKKRGEYISELADLEVKLVEDTASFNDKIKNLQLQAIRDMQKRVDDQLKALESSAVRSAGRFGGVVSPVPGSRITGHYGDPRPYRKGTHRGLDFAAPRGTPTLSIKAGTVVFAADAGGITGKMVKVQHTNGDVSKYMHLDRVDVAQGQQVLAGQQIGTVGSTGTKNSGPHTHFEYHRGGRPIDPIDMFRQEGPDYAESAKQESKFQALRQQQIDLIRREGEIMSRSSEETERLIQGLMDKGHTLRESADLDKKEIAARKAALDFVQTRASAEFIRDDSDLARQVYLRSQGSQESPEVRLAAIAEEAAALDTYIRSLLESQAKILENLATDPNNAVAQKALVETQNLIQDAAGSMAELRNDAIAISGDVAAAIGDAFNIANLGDHMRMVMEEDIRALSGDIRETISGAFQEAGSLIADSLFNAEAEGNLADRMDQVFRKMFEDIVSRIFTAYFNKFVANAFTGLEGFLGGKKGAETGLKGAVEQVTGATGPSVGGVPAVHVTNMPAAGLVGGGASADTQGAAGDVVDATKGMAKDIAEKGAEAADESKGFFGTLFSKIGGIFNSTLGLFTGSGGGAGFGGIIKGVMGLFGFARGGMIHGIPGIDKIPGYAVGRAGAVSPIAVSSQESILNRDATAALGERQINALNADPRRFKLGSLATAKVSNSGMGRVATGAERMSGGTDATLEALDAINSLLAEVVGPSTLRLEVPESFAHRPIRELLLQHLDEIVEGR